MSVTSVSGFQASGIHAGIRNNKTKRDLALLFADTPCSAAGVFTTNKVKAAPVQLSQAHIKCGQLRGVIINSGNANACAPDGMDNAHRMVAAAAKSAGCLAEELAVCSTGVIGQRLPIDVIEKNMPRLFSELSDEGGADAALAIMTTDTLPKESAIQVNIGNKLITIGGMAKGTGMMAPNMATMLAFITTDCAISAAMLDAALRSAVNETFNMVTVDGDTSTNDTVIILANERAGNTKIITENADYVSFCEALTALCRDLAKQMARDGEGATKLITVAVKNADTILNARKLAKSVMSSSLVKAALFGADANWGRILCALGYSGVDFNPAVVDVSFRSAAGDIDVCRHGMGLDFCEDTALKVLQQNEIIIAINMNDGTASAEAYGCDLTYEYVKINGEYRT